MAGLMLLPVCEMVGAREVSEIPDGKKALIVSGLIKAIISEVNKGLFVFLKSTEVILFSDENVGDAGTLFSEFFLHAKREMIKNNRPNGKSSRIL